MSTLLPQFQPSANPAAAPSLTSGSPATAPITSPRVTPGASTSGPLTHTLATHEFPRHGKPARKATAPKSGPTRMALLRRIVEMKTEPEKKTTIAPGSFGLNIGDDIRRLFGGTNLTTTMPNIAEHLLPVFNTIARHVLKKPGFTADKTPLTQHELDEIRRAATQRLDERQKAASLQQASERASRTRNHVTGKELYTLFVRTYDSGAKGATPTTPALTNAQVWNKRFVDMGVTSTLTPSPATAQNAYKQVLKMAAEGNTTAAKVIQTQTKKYAKTLENGQATVGTGITGQSLSDYYVQQFTTLAHQYLVPMSQETINQRAALAAQEGGTYQVKDNEIADFQQTVQKQAASLYSTFATQINKGVSTQTLLNPYAEVAARTLGYGGTSSTTQTAMDALGITWMQPKWNPAISGGKSATGKMPAPMSLTQWRAHLITTPQYGWQHTNTAQQMKLSVGQNLAQAFGLRKA